MKNSLLARRLSLLAIACGAVTLASLEASASIITIVNPSFEDLPLPGNYNAYTMDQSKITGWSVSGAAGIWRPDNGKLGLPLPVGNGSQVGWIGSAGGSMSQSLAAVFEANTTYTLSIDVRGQPTYSPGTTYSVQLFAGTTSILSITPVSPPETTWTSITATSTATGSSSLFSQPLSIRISGPTKGEFDFDNVRLTSVPEPSTYLAGLAALGMLVWVGRRNRR